MHTFKIKDTVREKGGIQLMEVENFADEVHGDLVRRTNYNRIICKWYENGKEVLKEFSPDELILVA